MLLRKILNQLNILGRASPGAGRRRADKLIARGNAAEREGRMAEACRCYRAAVAVAPAHAASHLNLGIALEALGDPSAAVHSYEAALGIDAGNAYASYNLGKALFVQGDLLRAETLLRAALASKPDFPEALVVLASIFEGRGELDAAAVALEHALVLRPGYEGALRNYGMLLDRLGRPSEAEQALKRAIGEDPADAQAHFDMGNVLVNTGRLEDAAKCFRKALALDPLMANAQVNLSNVLNDLGLQREALASAEAAIALRPESPEARWVHLMCRIPGIRGVNDDLPGLRKRFAAELDELDTWFDAKRSAGGHAVVGLAQPFWLAYQEEDNRELLQRYGGLCARLMADWQARQGFAPAPRRSPGPVRVSVVSRYFHNHSVWNALVKGWFQQFDRERFALSAFCLGSADDHETRYAKSRAERFVQGAGGLRQWVDAILASQPDVLIYPEIGMDPLSLKLASLRLAPLQAASWGHPETTGLPTVDCYLSAENLEPGEAQGHYTERLVALPNLGCYLQPETMNPAPPDLAALGIEPAVPLLLCPGTPFKYAPEHDWVLVEIARRLERCQLVFFEHRLRTLSAALRARLAAAFAARGLDFDGCVRFIPWQSRASFHGLLGRAQVFLDSIGFSGFNTALQAVECGSPIVTRDGRFLRGRLASGILKRIGTPDLVAADEEQYVALAVRLARDADYRAEVRTRMQAGRPLLYEDLAPIRALEEFLAQGL